MIPGFRLQPQVKNSRREWQRRAATSADSAKKIADKYDELQKNYDAILADVKQAVSVIDRSFLRQVLNRRVLQVIGKYRSFR